jgi:response regulator of citrate/malate metabolism
MIRTLIVDDDFRVAELHRAYVERVPGFSVVGLTGTGSEALRLIQQLQPDLVLLDIYLPDISGLEVLRTLRDSGGAKVDVIAITAARDVDTLRSAMHGGVAQYLIKPFRSSALEEKLQSYALMRSRLLQLSEADQDAVDRLYGTLWPGHAERPPKGLARPTSGLTAAEVAERASLSRVTARRYLDHLCRVGLAKVAMRYGAPGRPEHRYRLLAGSPVVTLPGVPG